MGDTGIPQRTLALPRIPYSQGERWNLDTFVPYRDQQRLDLFGRARYLQDELDAGFCGRGLRAHGPKTAVEVFGKVSIEVADFRRPEIEILRPQKIRGAEFL